MRQFIDLIFSPIDFLLTHYGHTTDPSSIRIANLLTVLITFALFILLIVSLSYPILQGIYNWLNESFKSLASASSLPQRKKLAHSLAKIFNFYTWILIHIPTCEPIDLTKDHSLYWHQLRNAYPQESRTKTIAIKFLGIYLPNIMSYSWNILKFSLTNPVSLYVITGLIWIFFQEDIITSISSIQGLSILTLIATIIGLIKHFANPKTRAIMSFRSDEIQDSIARLNNIAYLIPDFNEALDSILISHHESQIFTIKAVLEKLTANEFILEPGPPNRWQIAPQIRHEERYNSYNYFHSNHLANFEKEFDANVKRYSKIREQMLQHIPNNNLSHDPVIRISSPKKELMFYICRQRGRLFLHAVLSGFRVLFPHDLLLPLAEQEWELANRILRNLASDCNMPHLHPEKEFSMDDFSSQFRSIVSFSDAASTKIAKSIQKSITEHYYYVNRDYWDAEFLQAHAWEFMKVNRYSPSRNRSVFMRIYERVL